MFVDFMGVTNPQKVSFDRSLLPDRTIEEKALTSLLAIGVRNMPVEPLDSNALEYRATYQTRI